MSVYATDPSAGTFSILFAVVGKGTGNLMQIKHGEELGVHGPLGNAFTLPRGTKRMILVAGGVGLPPLDFWARSVATSAKKKIPEIQLLFGARTADQIIRTPRTKSVRYHFATDDGSRGFHGTVIDLLAHLKQKASWTVETTVIYGCGPTPMLKALQSWIIKNNFEGQLSLEELMPCGFGVCSGCVVPARPADEGYDRYVRVCHDGPVFGAREIAL